jgi:hypothetical protein
MNAARIRLPPLDNIPKKCSSCGSGTAIQKLPQGSAFQSACSSCIKEQASGAAFIAGDADKALNLV